MLTDPGAGALAQTVAGWLADARMEVSDGSQSARAPATVSAEGARVALSAEFGEGDGNFDWRIVRILLGETVIDEERGDFGRKAGGVVSHTVTISVAPAA